MSADVHAECPGCGVHMQSSHRPQPHCTKACGSEVYTKSNRLLTLCTGRVLVLQHNRTMCMLFLLVYVLCLLQLASAQDLRTFPGLFNIAQEKPVVTNPSDGTCGLQVRSAFCRSSVVLQSVLDCTLDYCDHSCPTRTSTPLHRNLLTQSTGYGPCVSTDASNTRPGSGSSTFSSWFRDGSQCFLTPINLFSLGTNGAFTVTAWVWLQDTSTGTIFDKYTSAQSILRLRISTSTLHLEYRSSLGVELATFTEPIPMQQWTHVAVQVYSTTMSYYINGVTTGSNPVGTQTLLDTPRDFNDITVVRVRVGKSGPHNADTIDNQFRGRMQDLNFYSETLTNREIQEVYEGTLPSLYIQSECRCPSTHPRIQPLQTHYCIPNGMHDSTADRMLRLNQESHSLAYINDDDHSTYWVSSLRDDILIEVDLGDQYEVFYVVLQFYSPQPLIVTIERMKDYSSAWTRWQVYSNDCLGTFGLPPNGPISSPDSYNCIQFASNGQVVPYSKGNITFNMLSPTYRPEYSNFYDTPALQEFVKAVRVRVRFQGHFYTRDPRHNYNALYSFGVTGRCNCHGHAALCDESVTPYVCDCLPESHTVGNRCDQCEALYNDKPFMKGTQEDAFNCKPCQCNGHADSCTYDASIDTAPDSYDLGGGGVCTDCQHHTAGRMCETCVDYYYRPVGTSLFDIDACQSCQCNVVGLQSVDSMCEKVGGQCGCKVNVGGRQCDQCNVGYYNLQIANPLGCEQCFCVTAGTIGGDTACHPTLGTCTCKSNVRQNTKCGECEPGFYNLDATNSNGCQPCLCHAAGSAGPYCNPNQSGQCPCKTNVIGQTCDTCANGFYSFNYDLNGGCLPCGCNTDGAVPGSFCNKETGQCLCKANSLGLRCDECVDGFYNLGSSVEFGCTACGCNTAGTNSSSSVCDKTTGACVCKENVDGQRCNLCSPFAFNLTENNPAGCTPCDCDITGTLGGTFDNGNQLSCDQNTGQCACLANRFGSRCEDCLPGFHVSTTPGGGCDTCSCNVQGTLRNTVCDSTTGQCECAPSSGVSGLSCDTCEEFYFNYEKLPDEGYASCDPCDCDPAGSTNNTCDVITGQCECKQFVMGRQCNVCEEGSSNLEADNPYGCSKVPTQQPPPMYWPLSSTALHIYWDPPDYPNGVILIYFLYRDGEQIAALEPNGTDIFDEVANSTILYHDDVGLQEFTQYAYRVQAVNEFGGVFSPTVLYRTPDGTPSPDTIIIISDITSNGATFGWTLPSEMNGEISRYVLLSTNLTHPDEEQEWYEGLSMGVTLTDLISYTYYTFYVRTCNTGGACALSSGYVAETLPSVPQNQPLPTISVRSDTELFVEWGPPILPNGIIIYYELWIRGTNFNDLGQRDVPETRLFHPAGQYSPRPFTPGIPPDTTLPPPVSNFLVTNLLPYHVYEFQVFSENSMGKVSSSWASGQTQPAVPLAMTTPVIIPINSNDFNVTWAEPALVDRRGMIISYAVFNYFPRDPSDIFAPPFYWVHLNTVSGSDFHYVAAGYSAHSTETFMVESCNSVGCVNSTEASATSSWDVPGDQPYPFVQGYNSSAMLIDWDPPLEPNSPHISYRVTRSEVAVSNPPPHVDGGTRFPGSGYYLFPSDTVPQNVAFTGVRLWFKTKLETGLLVFAISEDHQEFFAVQLRFGRPWFLFDPQVSRFGCQTELTINPFIDGNRTYSDGQWHQLYVAQFPSRSTILIDNMFAGCATIVTTTDDEGLKYNNYEWQYLEAWRTGKRGNLRLNDKWTGKNIALNEDGGQGKGDDCATGVVIGNNTGVYVGGKPRDMIIRRHETDTRQTIEKQNFSGCLRDIEILQANTPDQVWRRIEWDEHIGRSDVRPSWEGCPANLETGGLHFLGHGYLQISALPTMRFDTRMELFFRTEQRHGLIFFLHAGTGTYTYMDLRDGDLYVELSLPDKQFQIVFSSENVTLCDGLWHRVMFDRDNLVLTLIVDDQDPIVDGEQTAPGVRTPITWVGYTYFGGIPENTEVSEFIERHNLQLSELRFAGCMKEVAMDRKLQEWVTLSEVVSNPNVYLDGCPVNTVTQETCQHGLTTVIEENTNDTFTYDYDLNPFTEYLYQIDAINQIGSTTSIWTSGRTRPGPPTSVSPPTGAAVISGYELDVFWQPLIGSTGPLIQFSLIAYDTLRADVPPIVYTYNDTNMNSSLISVKPYTNYSLHMEVCTVAGCTESTDGFVVETIEEAPSGIDQPRVLEQGSLYLYLGWNEPVEPNGIMVGYQLFKDGQQIYTGALLEFNVTDLDVYTSYTFALTACNSICASSDPIALSTIQEPPGEVLAPILLVLGDRRIQVDWFPPSVINGVLERYIIYVSSNILELGDVGYNNTDLFTRYVVNDLIPGTTYYITISACTSGGCTLSSASSARTEESSPEGIADPIVDSPDPSSLNVTWTEPEFPNGVITEYRLVQNDRVVYITLSNLEFLIDGLQPWSRHTVRVEACTLRGCGSSNTVDVRTMESQPQGSVTLNAIVIGSREVNVRWTAPLVPNGLLVYDVYFQGLFYVDPDQGIYITQTDKRSLHQTEQANVLVTIENLIPYTEYFITVNASNSAGYLISNNNNALRVDMPMGTPDGVLPPTLTSLTSTSVRAVWQTVGRNNADHSPTYQLQFRETTLGAVLENMFDTPTTSTSFIKTNLVPYTVYQFRVVASNNFGDTTSIWADVQTLEDSPVSVEPPQVTNIESRTISLTWSAPLVPNGVIVSYNLYMNDAMIETLLGNETSITVSELTPDTTYSFTIEACTIGGCTQSDSTLDVVTLRASPEGLILPSLTSDTSTSVIIVWGPPTEPNGDIISYTIQRQQIVADVPGDIFTVATLLPPMEFNYRDTSELVMPYTTYEYRIIVANAAGQSIGDWVRVVTDSSTPSGLLPPVVVVYNATSLIISWTEPRETNGVLLHYLIKLPAPLPQITDVDQRTITVIDLEPFTEYTVTVSACTDKGCTMSEPTVVYTDPTLPQGLDAPTVTAHSQTYISVQWTAPQFPNGPNIRYELARSKIREPLNPDATDFNTWLSIYTGNALFYDDRLLTMFTTYRYRISAYNDFGVTISETSVEITTHGGIPTSPPVLTAIATSHTSIQTSWTTPDVFELQGAVVQYILRTQSSDTDTTQDIPPHLQSFLLQGLTPNTAYVNLLTIVTYGGETISSELITTTTEDGAPQGLAPPLLFGENESTLRVSWTAPTFSNGAILGYYIYIEALILERIRIDTEQTEPGFYLVTNLAPYVIYTVQIEVCTEFDCITSDSTSGTTAEAISEGLRPPTLTIGGSDVITANWYPPNNPNGIIVSYQLLRSQSVSCDEIPTTPPPVEFDVCMYVECLRSASLCGSVCYTGQQTCCSGVLYDNDDSRECCGELYVLRRLRPSQICCGGKFYDPLLNHECCGGRYTDVPPGSICCVDPVYDRVSVGLGDTCCSGVPFMQNGPQLCCNDVLSSRYGYQCCGAVVVPDTSICCGTSDSGEAYESEIGRICCGMSYVLDDRSVCCTDENGKEKAHIYSSALEKSLSNEQCCGVERISIGLSCCSNVGYNPNTQICADRSDQQDGCGATGTICSISQTQTAFCNRCDFDRSTMRCDSTNMLSPTDENHQIGGSTEDGDLCQTAPAAVYEGFDFRYVDTMLSPYTSYHYYVMVSNGAGSINSDVTTAVTAESLPLGMDPPITQTQINQLNTIYLSWTLPASPNGIITGYQLYRDDVEVFRTAQDLSFVDNNAIQAYRVYSYRIRACNSVGCVESDEVSVSTLQWVPEQVIAPLLRQATFSTIELYWSEPLQPNGEITEYYINVIGNGFSEQLAGDVYTYTIIELLPYTAYTITLTACTSVGCTNSTETVMRTMEGVPQDISPPILIITDSRTIEVWWSAPATPNGLIMNYEVSYQAVDGSLTYTVIYTGLPLILMYRHNTGLIPTWTYQYHVRAENGVGYVTSDSTAITLPALTPQGMTAPTNTTALSSTTIYVEWEAPQRPNGLIDQYRVLLNSGTPDATEHGVGVELDTVIGGLSPYTLYTVRIAACLAAVSEGCGVGAASEVRTLESAPQMQPAPTLEALGPSVVLVIWEPPSRPNGVILEFRIHRRDVAFPTSNGLLINDVGGEVRSFRNSGSELLPFTSYQYRVTAVNSIGETTSDWSTVRTLEAPPFGLAPPTVVSRDAYSVRIAWTPVQSPNGRITMYRLEYKENNIDPTSDMPLHIINLPPDGLTEVQFSGLQPYTMYDMRMVAVNNAGEVASVWIQTRTDQAAPGGLKDFSIEKMTSGEAVILRWQTPMFPNGLINNYLIYELDNVNPIYQGMAMEFEYRRLQPYTTYMVQLEACNPGGCGRSAHQTFTTAEVLPTDQPAPIIGNSNSTHVVIQWSKPVNANGRILRYQVLRRSESLIAINARNRRRKREVSEPIVIYTTSDTDQDSYTYVDTSLNPYTRYEYSVTASNSQGTTQSDWTTIDTDQAPPAGVLAPIVSQMGSEANKLRITWSIPIQPNGELLNYLLTRDDNVPLNFGPNEEREYVDEGLISYTDYTYTITACTQGGCTESSSTTLRTPETSPFSVNPPSVQTLSSTALLATWTEPQITNGMIREYRLLVDSDVRYTGSEMSYTVNNLMPYQLYMFVLRACTYGGCTDSSSVSGRPSEAPPLGMNPPTLRVTSSTSIEVTWAEPDFPNGIITSYEVYRDNTLIDDTLARVFTDIQVQPGHEYSYNIKVWNSQGSAESLPTSATTYASSPSGLNAPLLQPTSSTSIRATWTAPLYPNGDIYNYTLYNDNELVYTGGPIDMSYEVRDLTHWTEYSFRIESCTLRGCTMSQSSTARTLESVPQNMAAPRLQPYYAGIRVEWAAPLRPNGVLTEYKLYRRPNTGQPNDVFGGPRALLYTGIQLVYDDREEILRPNTEYDYAVEAYNSRGYVSSVWATGTTFQAAPTDTPTPQVRDVTTTTITLRIFEPSEPNGYIARYDIYVDNELTVQSRFEVIEIGQNDPLSPYTEYDIYVSACTGGGCTDSDHITARTDPADPVGMAAPVISDIQARSVHVSWDEPTQPNGEILRYQLMMRQTCPYPYAGPGDKVTVDCEPTSFVNLTDQLSFSKTVENLAPYTEYEFYVIPVNGHPNQYTSHNVSVVITAKTEPAYNQLYPPTIVPSTQSIRLDWTNSFIYNGEVLRFVLKKDDGIVYTGDSTTYTVTRDNVQDSYTFEFFVYTDVGSAATPLHYFVPGNDFLVTVAPTTAEDDGLEWYEELYFIIPVVLIALFIVFLAIVVCLKCNCCRTSPYLRSTLPLPQQRKRNDLLTAEAHAIDPYNGNLVHNTDITTLPRNTGSMPRNVAHVGYVNPALSHASIPSRPVSYAGSRPVSRVGSRMGSRAGSLVDLNLDHLSHWDDDVSDDLPWDGQVPHIDDSGLHSLVYGDDFDGLSEAPISVIKEQQVFTDTHL